MTRILDDLSAHEFTLLVRDLLGKKENITLSVSPEGPDGGIDILKSGPIGSHEIVVQCKRYSRSGWSKLLGSLKKEVEKVKRINPARYVIAVSNDLTILQKETILNVFRPYINSVDDVFSGTDIEGLIRDFPQVERAHPSLWMRSATVLREIVAHGTSVWTKSLIAEMEDTSKTYVQTPTFERALDILEKDRIVIISGSAGIGKSTLARMLVQFHVHSGYHFVELESLDEEQKDLPDADQTILFFDDFLGRSIWKDNASPVLDKRMSKLLSLVERKKNYRLVMTSRGYLLESAKKFSDTVAERVVLKPQLLLEMKDYSRSVKAQILYRHLYHRGVSPDFCESLVANKFYRQIISHRNFVPRLIDWICTPSDWPSDITATSFPDFILRSLNNPQRLYTDTIENRISDEARKFLLCTFVCGGGNEVREEYAIQFYNRSRTVRGKSEASSREIVSILKELDGSLIRFVQKNDTSRWFTFLNAGVSDAIKREITECEDDFLWLVQCSDHAEELFDLSTALSSFLPRTLAGESVELPVTWYRRWIEIAQERQTSADEFLEALGKAMRSNVFVTKLDVARECIELIYTSADSIDYRIEWDRIYADGFHSHVPKMLDGLAWFKNEFVEALSWRVNHEPFMDVFNNFEYLDSGFGNAGSAGQVLLVGKAEERCRNLLSNVFDIDGSRKSYLEESEYEEVRKIATRFELEEVLEELEDIESFEASSESEGISPQRPELPPEELSDDEIHALFTSLTASEQNLPE